MIRWLSIITCFSFVLNGCHGGNKYSNKTVALEGCKKWQAAGRTVDVKISSFHSGTKGYQFLVFSRDCINDDESNKILGYVYPLVESGGFEVDYAMVSFRSFLDVSSAKGPASFVKSFAY